MSSRSPSGIEGRRRALAVALIAVFACAGIVRAAELGVGRSLDDFFYDAFLRARYAIQGNAEASPFVVQVEYDDESARRLGAGLLARDKMAALVDALSEAGAKAIVLDYVFYGGDDNPGTAALSAAAERSGRVFMGLYCLPGGAVGAATVDLATKDKARVADAAGRFPAVREALVPPGSLMRAVAGLGHLNALPDSDGVLRRLPAAYTAKEGAILALPLAAAVGALGVQASALKLESGRAVLRGALMPWGERRDVELPLSQAGDIFIDYPAPSSASFARYPAWRILSAPAEDRGALEREIGGSVVIVSEGSRTNAALFKTPFGEYAPSAEAVAAVISSIYSGRLPRPAASWIVTAATLALALGIALAARKRIAYAIAASAVALVATVSAGFAAFAAARILVPVGPLACAETAGLALSAAFRLEALRAEKRSLAAALASETAFSDLGKRIAGLGHNLKGLADLERNYAVLASGEKDELRRESYLLLMRRVSDELAETVHAINYISRAKSRETKEELSLRRLIEGIVALYGAGQETAPIRFESEEGDAFVEAVPLRLSQALENIIVNAIEACRELSPEQASVAIKLTTRESRATIVVCDSGCGIPWCAACADRESRSCLSCRHFERGKTTKEKGTGLGMIFARDTFAAMGGDLRIESSETGTAIAIDLPLAPCAAERATL
jgi:Signal transduction histidine kinase